MKKSEADVNNINNGITKNNLHSPDTSAGITSSLEDMYYDMSGDKYLIIYNHHKFKVSRYFRYSRPQTRHGTDADVARLKEVFAKLKYKVLTYHDLDYRQIVESVTEISEQDHTMTSCLVFVILTHGDKGMLYASDRPYLLSDLTTPLQKGDASLVTKPKIFFIQACRGDKIDDGREIVIKDSDADDNSFIIPSHADFCILYSAVEDYLSFRDMRGSFLIQDLCDVIEKYANELDLLQLITFVNRRVGYLRHTFTPLIAMTHMKKQMPEAQFTLTKLLKL